jgi:hypothetical protein
MKKRTPWRLITSAVASAALVGGALIAAPAANADTFSLTGPPVAVVKQSVTYTLASPSVGLWSLQSVTGTQSPQTLATQSVGAGASQVQFTFVTPDTATGNSPLVISAINSDTNDISNSLTLIINPVGTTTTITAPNVATVGKGFQVNVLVSSSGGSSYSPIGQVRVTDANNVVVNTSVLTASPGTGTSFAYFNYTPPAAGTYYFIATYVPSAGSQATASAPSAQDAVIATPSGNTIALSLPPSLNQGTPVNLIATVYPSTVKGTVAFTLNGNGISPAVPIVNGTATYTWTPNVSGTVTVGANYTTPNGGFGQTSQSININAAPAAADVITLVQPGWGAWANGGSYNMGNGSNFTFQASTLSGAPVTLTETGPCVVQGLTLQVNTGSGVCNMKATSPGGRGYSGVTYNYTINLVPGQQSATLSAPASGRYKVGRVLVLESPDQQDTNAGQNINWNVKKPGKKTCQLLYPSTGAVTLKIKGKGTCTVIGSAPGVPGQWLKFQTARQYTGR